MIINGNGKYIVYSEDGLNRYHREYKDGKEINSKEIAEKEDSNQ